MTVIPVAFESNILTEETPASEVARELRLGLAVLRFSRGQISQSKAAEIAGLSRADFIDALAASDISPCQETVADIDRVLARG